MTFGEDWGWGSSKEEGEAIFHAFVEAGGNFIDTANNYTNGTSERHVADLIASERDRFVVATKYTLNRRPGDPNAGGNHRKSLVQSLEGSLQRLRTDHIDLYWVHAWDFMTPIDEVMRALDDAVRAGKVLYVGVSDAPAWIVSRANTMADLRGWSPFVALQIKYSLLDRSAERDLLPMAAALDLAVLPWAVLGGGILTGKYGRGEGLKPGTRFVDGNWGNAPLTERPLRIADAVTDVAREIGRSPAQVAINWVRRGRGVIIPILGARRTAQLQDNLETLEFELTDEQRARLEDASAIELGFPHDFLRSEMVRKLMHAGTFEKIDVHRPRS
jgi:aryl-alcohol dehydrogenase-like predicted oxidoreductase